MDTALNSTTVKQTKKPAPKNSTTQPKSSGKAKPSSTDSGSVVVSTGIKGWQDVQVDRLVAADWNYKKDFDDPDVVERMVALKENIKRNGLIVNILVRELSTGYLEVLDGNHRLQVIRELGIDKAHAYNFGEISDAKAQRLSLEINENSFEADPIKLGRLIKDLSVEMPILDLAMTLPYTPDQLSNYVEMTNFSWGDEGVDESGGTSEGEKKDKEEFEAIRIPASLVSLFNQQMKRARLCVSMATERQVSDDEVIAPFETILGVFAKLEDYTIIDDLKGGTLYE